MNIFKKIKNKLGNEKNTDLNELNKLMREIYSLRKTLNKQNKKCADLVEKMKKEVSKNKNKKIETAEYFAYLKKIKCAEFVVKAHTKSRLHVEKKEVAWN